jgi:hypothetical protein
MIEQLAADAADESFGCSVLPWSIADQTYSNRNWTVGTEKKSIPAMTSL